jgi:hypothetical protein
VPRRPNPLAAALTTAAAILAAAPVASAPLADAAPATWCAPRAAGAPARTAARVPLLAAPSAAVPSSASDPWSWLARVRRSLVDAGPTGAAFTQTYVPAGFTSGEQESGSLSLHLPDCLRWDYREPYPKGFLLCGDLVHAWNPEDHTGRRYRIDRRAEPGLDLLLLGVDDLRARYEAATRSLANGQVEIALSPKARGGQLSDATLAIDPATLRVVGVSYHDREGNLTRFQISGYRALEHGGEFAPPGGIQWEEQP